MSGKVKFNQLSEGEKMKNLGEFYDMVAMLNSRDEAKIFFKDLLTLSEIVMITRRIQVAKKLLRSKSYIEIRNEMGVGNSTINQVDRWLNNGFGGYKHVLKKYSKIEKKRKSYSEMDPLSFTALRKRYPAHFLLFNLLMGDE